ncbi:MAG: glycerophosphodiester phosphodiesterase [Desulfosarcina sp.]|nr:glycerophosphodiester phosphodiesterase [Desulfosarcina sp.]MBC2743386.1 glycerophosphodiester phosphodiesterase [Desulfosarcina sp.]MBC2766296.1 glycerophosphodiester phosphodiesterase [Desulfosarcina sp.]
MNIKILGGKTFLMFAFIFSFITIISTIAGDLNVIGHRGAAGLLPENTLAGFKKAMDIGVDTIELDIRLTSDNEAVVYHDSRLNPATTRDTNGEWIKERHLIKELTLSEIQSYDVGKLNRWKGYAKKYPDQKPAEGERIPTLRDVIQLVKRTGGKTHLFIELKFSPLKPEETKSPEEISNVVAKVIKDENITERVTVISFDWKTLMYFQGIMSEVPTGYVTIAKKDFDTIQKNKSGASPWMAGIDIDTFDSIPKAVKSAGGTYWITNCKHVTGHNKNITSKIVEKSHSEGIKVIVWTPDSKSNMKKLIKIGVDGVTTNRPDILLSILKR